MPTAMPSRMAFLILRLRSLAVATVCPWQGPGPHTGRIRAGDTFRPRAAPAAPTPGDQQEAVSAHELGTPIEVLSVL